MKFKNKSALPRFVLEPMERRLLLSSVTVNTPADETDAPGSQTVSLRDAIAAADTAAAPTTITFDPTVFVAQQTIVLSYALEIAAGANVTIIGPETGLTVGGAGSETDLLTVDSGATASISQMSFSNGDNFGNGGAIVNSGTLSLTGCTLSQNTAGNAGNGSQPGSGGAIANSGTLSMTNCTVSGNSVFNPLNTNGAGNGGGLLNTGTATLLDDTFSANAATSGGGIFSSGTLTICNTIVAGNGAEKGPDIDGVVTSDGHNLIGQTDGSSGWISTDLTGTTASALSADLGSLADNGGPALTMLPSSSSPAIQHGSISLVPVGVTTDERRLPRIFNGNVDIGAVEVQGASNGLISTSTSLQSAGGRGPSSITLTATVTPSAGGVPTGSVVFSNGSTQLGTANLASNGTAVLTVNSLPIGLDSVTATYDGDGTFQSSTSAPLFVTVNATGGSSTDISLQASSESITVGTLLTLTATLTTTGSGTPTGTVSFSQAGTTLGSTAVTPGGQGSITVAALPVGIDAITASYTGDANFESSTSSPVNVTVNGAGTSPSTISLQASTGTAGVNQPVALTATVATASGTATGIISFLQNGTLLGTATVNSSGIGTLTTSALPVGSDSITAAYSGDSTFQPSTSAPIEVAVTATISTVNLSLNASANSITAGAPLTLTATLTPNGSGTPTGTVTFSDNNALLGTTAVDSSGIESITVAALPAGTDSITASYSGDSVFASNISGTVDVNVSTQVSGFAPAVTKSSLPAHIISGVKFSSSLLVSLANSLSTDESGAYALNILASPTATLDTTSDYLLATVKRKTGKIAPNKSIKFSVPLTSVPAAMPAGAYYLLLEATDAAGNIVALDTGLTADVEAQSVALVETFSKVTLPATAGVAGQPVHATARVTITNNGNVPSRGPTKIVLSAADATTGQDTGNPITTLTRTLSIRPGASVEVTVPITEYPTVPAAAYNLQVQVTDPFASNVSLAFSQTAFNIVEPFVQLSATFPRVTAANIKVGAALTITNSGNVDNVSKFTAVIGFSTDAAGQNIVATGAGIVSIHPLRIRAGKTAKLSVSGWKALLSGVSAGSYYLTVTLTDAGGNAASAVSGLVIVPAK